MAQLAHFQGFQRVLLVGMAGMLGDLAESMLKRDVGRKDSSTWLPGFGGVYAAAAEFIHVLGMLEIG